jgi:hypothetical protein
MKKIPLLLLLLVGFMMSAHAQTPASPPAAPDAASASKPAPAALPSADEILAHNLQAVGGAAAWQKLNSRTSKGTMEITAMGASGAVELDQKAPNKLISTATITGFGDFQQAYDGTAGWADDPQNGVRDLSGGELIGMKRRADFYLPMKMKESFAHVTVKGVEKVGDHDAYVLEATPAEGEPETLYFDVQSGLLLKRASMATTPQGQFPVEQLMEDYKDVDGVKVPFTLRQTSPVAWVIRLTDVHQNVPIDDAKFAKPAPEPAPAK